MTRIFIKSISIINTYLQYQGNGAFSYSPNIKQFVTLQGTTRIGNRVCSYCPSLTSLTLADSVISIGYSAFSYIPNLPCIFWAGPVGISIDANDYDSIKTKPICATDSSLPSSGNLRPTLQPTILTPSPTAAPTISQNPTLSPSVIKII